jgi:hypothetical protein
MICPYCGFKISVDPPRPTGMGVRVSGKKEKIPTHPIVLRYDHIAMSGVRTLIERADKTKPCGSTWQRKCTINVYITCASNVYMAKMKLNHAG